MSEKSKTYSPKFKVDFVLKAMSYPDGISAYCRKTGIKESRFYAWKQMLLTNAESVFNPISMYFLLIFVDVYSRYIPYHQLMTDMTSQTVRDNFEIAITKSCRPIMGVVLLGKNLRNFY